MMVKASDKRARSLKELMALFSYKRGSVTRASFTTSSLHEKLLSTVLVHNKAPTPNLRTTLCVRFKSEVVACGVVHAAARRFQVPLPENPPWWLVFDSDQQGIEEVCRVLAHLYSLPKAVYVPVFTDNDSFAPKTNDAQPQVSKESLLNANDTDTPKILSDSSSSKGALIKAALDKLKGGSKDDLKCSGVEAGAKEDSASKPKGDYKSDGYLERKERDRERAKARDRDSRGRDSERDREKLKEHRSKDKGSGHSEKRHHSSRDRSEHTAREERRRHHAHT